MFKNAQNRDQVLETWHLLQDGKYLFYDELSKFRLL
jgi:hypothetical protein